MLRLLFVICSHELWIWTIFTLSIIFVTVINFVVVNELRYRFYNCFDKVIALCSLTSYPSPLIDALEVCYDNVLYKFTFDIDIDIATWAVINV